ncbi:hypothetical protein SERLA73DRAFT_80933 [Serpula lacrymans var. lacrymans S7.3]|uniref:Uncharacterized protein n=1 Tax=Serpula lacrymans var. lacrymans (strain S7.3) TaxID=936435 RepID=F8QKH5_SERL3|nr:hypothetical protein SERLA73DRAFT_80933 [Serpula lacrymans var. lacrymans S7.3]
MALGSKEGAEDEGVSGTQAKILASTLASSQPSHSLPETRLPGEDYPPVESSRTKEMTAIVVR